MKREEKNQLISELTEQLVSNNVLYLTDMSAMTVEQSNSLRRMAFGKKVSIRVVKNTLLRKAMEKSGRPFDDLFGVLHGNTAVLFAEGENGNVPAKLLKEFRKNTKKPVLKAAFIDDGIYLGDEHLDSLVSLKSKQELIADVILLLQSPVKTVVSQLQSGGQKLSGVIKTLSERK